MTSTQSEADWQFEVALSLRNAGIPFKLELTTAVGRHDIAISDGVQMWGIIECKKGLGSDNSQQMTRYKSTGLPVMLSTSKRDGDPVKFAQIAMLEKGRTIESLKTDPSVIRRWRAPRSKWARLKFNSDECLNLRE